MMEIDWMQVLLNLMAGNESQRDGQPCFRLEGERFCLRAKFWHDADTHKFVPLTDVLAEDIMRFDRNAAAKESP
jgi:hypothetical protein